MGRALVVAEPGSVSPCAALTAEGWDVAVCAPEAAEAALTDDVELVACQLAFAGRAWGPGLLSRLLADHPEAGGFLFGQEVDDDIEQALLEAPDVPVVKVPAAPALVQLTVAAARTLPR